jgi:tetratricopeptide (TPR) repeat protein
MIGWARHFWSGALLLLLLETFLVATGAPVTLAQGSDAASLCFSSASHPSTPDQRIRGCTSLIDSGGTKPETLREALMNRASGYREKREYSQALSDINQAIRMKPNDVDSIFARALIYRAAGMRGAAISDYRTVVRVDPTYIEAKEALQELGITKTQAVPAQQAPSCGRIVGTWNWPNGSVMAFYKNGTAGTAGQPAGGTWRCSGSTVIAVFNNGGRDRYVVAPDGKTLSLTTNWIPGTYTATRQH